MIEVLTPRRIPVLVSFIIFCGLSVCFAQTNSKDGKQAGNSVLASEGSPTAATDKTGPAKNADIPGVAPDESYRIGVEDELHISVWHEAELSEDVVVRPDGMITMPLLNDVPVVGLSTGQLKDLLTEKLKPYVTEPQVTIVVRAIRSRRIYLAGQVMKPGAFPLNGRRTVLQLLLEAGGLGPYAKSDKIYVLRNMDGKQERLSFNYQKALKGEDAKQNFFLMPGDTIVVP